MVEVFTVGGGDYLVAVFRAVAAWTGNGGYKGLLQVVIASHMCTCCDSSRLQGKSSGQLSAMQDQIRARISGGDAVDIGYWETLLVFLKAWLCFFLLILAAEYMYVCVGEF